LRRRGARGSFPSPARASQGYPPPAQSAQKSPAQRRAQPSPGATVKNGVPRDPSGEGDLTLAGRVEGGERKPNKEKKIDSHRRSRAHHPFKHALPVQRALRGMDLRRVSCPAAGTASPLSTAHSWRLRRVERRLRDERPLRSTDPRRESRPATATTTPPASTPTAATHPHPFSNPSQRRRGERRRGRDSRPAAATATTPASASAEAMNPLLS
jgi:hypothetical protein